jgi:hypothetical protein
MYPLTLSRHFPRFSDLLIPAGKICGILSTAYLNPLLAVQLCLTWCRRHKTCPLALMTVTCHECPRERPCSRPRNAFPICK